MNQQKHEMDLDEISILGYFLFIKEEQGRS